MQENIHYRNEAEPTEVSTNNRYYVDMEARFEAFRNHEIDMRSLHTMVYDVNNVALAVRQLSKSSGKDALGPDGTSYSTLEPYSIAELSEIVKDRLLNKKMNYVRRTYIPKSNGKARPLGICSIWDKLVEKCIQLVLEPHCETQFVPSSFGFREQVSAHNALAKVKNHAQTTPFALAIDMDRAQDYDYYIDGITPSIARLVSACDCERLAVCRALGLEVSSLVVSLQKTYGLEQTELYDLLQHNAAYRGLKSPMNLEHRFIIEDLLCGIVPLASIGAELGVETPIMNAFIEIGSVVCGRDFRAQGRTAEKLGLSGKTPEQIQALIR